MTGEEQKFRQAFATLEARGEKPTPKALGLEMRGRAYRSLPGRLSVLRRQLLDAAGYVQAPAHGGGLGRWHRP